MKDKTEVEMTLKKNGRWFRFVQTGTWCSRCAFYKECNFYDGNDDFCPIGKVEVGGHFERFRPTSELVRIGVRLLKRASMMYHKTEFLCLAGVGNDNEIKFASYKFKREAYHPELLALIDRLNALGLIV